MPQPRAVLVLLVSSCALATTCASLAQAIVHHANGHDLLGSKLKENGNYWVGRAGVENVIAEVRHRKVTAMSAGRLPVKKVKTNKRMAAEPTDLRQVNSGGMKLAQVFEEYYGYCFDAGTDVYCYWYPATDVIVTGGWAEY